MKLQTLKSTVQTLKPKVAVMQPGSWRTDKMTSAQRGYGSKWQKAREGYLSKHWFCVYCLKAAGIQVRDNNDVMTECRERGITVPYATVVDHIAPHRGDMKVFWNSDQWQALCKPCHDSVKAREERQLGLR